MPTANELYAEATCFLCYGITQAQALKLALLRRKALELDPDADVTPEALLLSASCYNCYANGNLYDLFELALLAIIADNPCAPAGNVDGLIWGPAPETVDSIIGGTDALTTFMGTFFPTSTYTVFSFGNPTTVTNGIDFSNDTVITSMTFRLLETVGTELNFNTNVLTSFSAALLQTIGNDLNFGSSAALINLTLPALTSVVNQVFVNLGAIEVLSLPLLASYPTLGITADASLLTLNLPACVNDGAGQLELDIPNMTGLVTLNLNSISILSAGFDVSSSPNLSSLNLDALADSSAGIINVSGTLLTALNLPSLGPSNMLNGSGSPIVSVQLPLWVPADGIIITFNGCALNAASVELILRRCVLAGLVASTIDLSGGTNAGTASLSAQGQADVATLGAQVTMNP